MAKYEAAGIRSSTSEAMALSGKRLERRFLVGKSCWKTFGFRSECRWEQSDVASAVMHMYWIRGLQGLWKPFRTTFTVIDFLKSFNAALQGRTLEGASVQLTLL